MLRSLDQRFLQSTWLILNDSFAGENRLVNNIAELLMVKLKAEWQLLLKGSLIDVVLPAISADEWWWQNLDLAGDAAAIRNRRRFRYSSRHGMTRFLKVQNERLRLRMRTAWIEMRHCIVAFHTSVKLGEFALCLKEVLHSLPEIQH